ncbi:MAG: tetratricopeptide repeat protein [Euryhalocaulis sp.]|uniref:tetratricopeptide repeat protein n=1 Tax=Euryhalocaulis sp. TaxID=2744307 RepID=UPI0017B0A074|nr:tetratricopeptide repeat protein [Euryhalocaulis sp.]MBA4800683.1 tetratricopeptide repeat protein [Euryhalocaulis sp.]
MRALTTFLIFALVAVSLPQDASAQSRRELDERLRAVEATMRQMESRQMSGDPAAVRMLTRVDDLERQIQNLTSQVEEVKYENRQLKRQYEALQEDMFAVMDRGGAAGGEGEEAFNGNSGARNYSSNSGGSGDRGPVSLVDDPDADVAIVNPDDPNAEAKRAATRPLGSSVMDSRDMNADPDLLFAQAQTRLNEGDYGAARGAYQDFLAAAPDDPRRGEAYFWVGRLQLIEGESAIAAESLMQAMQAGGPRAPEAMVQLGVALVDMGQKNDACQTLGAVAQQFPQASDSVLQAASRERSRAGCS